MPLNFEEIQHLSVMQELEANPAIEPIIDLTPLSHTASLDENILALSAQLRTSGLTKYADNLESKFATFKQADIHLYRVHDEDGSDLVEFAHPDGDHNVEDGDLGDVETVVSKHNKIKDIVEKSPTGKLASYVAACKLALGQSSTNTEQLLREVNGLVNKAVSYLVRQANMDQQLQHWTREKGEMISSLVSVSLEAGPSDHNFQQIQKAITLMETTLEPSIGQRLFGASDMSDALWAHINGLFKAAQDKLSQARASFFEGQEKNISGDISSIEKEPSDIEPASFQEPKSREMKSFTRGPSGSSNAADTIQTLEGWKSQMAAYEDPEDVQAGTKWIDNAIAKLQTQPDAATLNKILGEVAQFKKTWKMR